MGTCYKLALWAVVGLLAIPAVAVAQSMDPWGDQAPLDATITLGRTPEPPDCAGPQDIVDIWWDITYSTTPTKVIFTIKDPNGVTVDSTYYGGATGVSIARQWTVPFSPVIGKYWVRVEFHSQQAGHEATAEVSFYVCEGIGRICAQKWVDDDCDGVGTVADLLVSGWWICIDTPWGDTFCDTTGANGEVCWENLPLGTYTVRELIAPPWIPIFPPSNDVVLDEATPERTVIFFNVNYDDCFGACCKCDGECVEVTEAVCDEIGYMFMGLGTHCAGTQCGAPSATEETTWSGIKDSYR